MARGTSVPILYYHRVQPVPADFSKWTKARQRRFLQYDAIPAAFVAQLDWLVSERVHDDPSGDLAAHWDDGKPLPPKPVIITFDDGSRSWTKRVMPELRERGMVAEFYLTLDAIKVDAIDWGDIRALVAAGNGIGAHDVHHVQIAGLPGKRTTSVPVMWKEINDIRAVILAHTGVAPDSMAYVGGGYDDTLMGLVGGRRLHDGTLHQPRHRPDRRPPLSPARRPDRGERRRHRPAQADARPGPAHVRQTDARRQRPEVVADAARGRLVRDWRRSGHSRSRPASRPSGAR